MEALWSEKLVLGTIFRVHFAGQLPVLASEAHCEGQRTICRVVGREIMFDSGQKRFAEKHAALLPIPALLGIPNQTFAVLVSRHLLAAHYTPLKTTLLMRVFHVKLERERKARASNEWEVEAA